MCVLRRSHSQISDARSPMTRFPSSMSRLLQRSLFFFSSPQAFVYILVQASVSWRPPLQPGAARPGWPPNHRSWRCLPDSSHSRELYPDGDDERGLSADDFVSRPRFARIPMHSLKRVDVGRPYRTVRQSRRTAVTPP